VMFLMACLTLRNEKGTEHEWYHSIALEKLVKCMGMILTWAPVSAIV